VTTRLLALDCSPSIGWCVFDDAKVVKFDTWHASRAFLLGDYGKTFLGIEEWLEGMVVLWKPTVLAFEAPLVPALVRSSYDIVRTLIGSVTVVELVGRRHGLRVLEVGVGDAKKRLTGNRWAKKRAMINGAYRLGHHVETDDEADAIAVGLVALDHLAGRRLV